MIFSIEFFFILIIYQNEIFSKSRKSSKFLRGASPQNAQRKNLPLGMRVPLRMRVPDLALIRHKGKEKKKTYKKVTPATGLSPTNAAKRPSKMNFFFFASCLTTAFNS